MLTVEWPMKSRISAMVQVRPHEPIARWLAQVWRRSWKRSSSRSPAEVLHRSHPASAPFPLIFPSSLGNTRASGLASGSRTLRSVQTAAGRSVKIRPLFAVVPLRWLLRLLQAGELSI